MADAQRRTRSFKGAVVREMGELQNFLTSTGAKLASFGAGFAVGAEIVKSANLDKTLTRIGQTAGATQQQVRGLRGELFGMAGQTGRATDDLTAGFDVLVQSGLQWGEARATLGGINKAMAVTGAQADTLAGSLGVASTAFDFDLAKPRMALDLLDKMTVAGRLGNAELENLGSIFARVGVNAQGAGFSFDQTLAFIEGLSMIERQPERLATLADSTIRLFTNARYMAAAQKATGVRFFDNKTGARRDPLETLADLKKIMDGMKTDAQREGFLSKAFGNADLDTIKGLRTLLSGDSLSKVVRFTSEIGGASGTIERDLPAAIANAVDQTGRLKARLKDAADAFAQPINDVYTKVLAKALGDGSEGSGLSNAGLIGTGVATVAGGYVLKRVLGGLAGRLLSGAGSLAGGVAMGTALEKAGAATPVFIVGAAPGLLGGGAGGLLPGAAGGAAGGVARRVGTGAILRAAAGTVGVGTLATMGTGGAAMTAGGVGVAGAAGWGIGTLISKGLQAYLPRVDNSIGAIVAKGFLPALPEIVNNAIAGAKDIKQQLIVDVNVNDNLTTVRTRTVGKDFVNVRSGSSSTYRTGRAMADRGGDA
ncbi:phage tail tape measure protein [Luteimonas soli]|uniref:Phage tail tape measure protein n=1 Tax=Luteimonas soli TaxID=1648966 RepID=A0ABV7XM68_9GAMM